MVKPLLAEIAQEYPEVLVGKINVDEEMELAQKFSVVSIPMLVVMKDGKISAQAVGYRDKEQILDLLGI